MGAAEQEALSRLVLTPPPASGTTSKQKYLGVPDDYAVTRPFVAPPGNMGPPQPTTITPRYFEGDEWRPASLRAEDRAKVQRALLAAGLIDDDAELRLGVWDDVSRNAYKDLLSFANASGLDEVSALHEWSAQAERFGSPTSRGRQLPTVRLSNPNDVAAVTDEVARRVLGRRADPADIDRIVKALHAEEARFGQQAAVGGTVVNPTTPAELAGDLLESAHPEEADQVATRQIAQGLLSTLLANKGGYGNA